MNINFKDYKCKECNENGFVVNPLSITSEKCDCRIKFENILRTFSLLKDSGLLFDYSSKSDFDDLNSYTFDKYVGEDKNKNIDKLKMFVERFEDETKPFSKMSFYIYGNQGCQKSYTVKGILSLLAKKNHSVYYILAKDLVDLIIKSERDDEKKDLLNYIQSVDCLCIEELNAKRMALWNSGFKQEILVSWLKTRLEVVHKSTFIISNDTIEEFKKSELGELLGDLVERECKFGTFEFTDNYGQNMSEEDFKKKFDDIWS